MNILPDIHASLISMPKLADAGYVTDFKKDIASV
jgi:hypothetical protein